MSADSSSVPWPVQLMVNWLPASTGALNLGGGTGTIDENVCERCEASPNVGWPFRVDPDLVSIDGDTMPGEPDRYFVVIDPEDVWGLPS